MKRIIVEGNSLKVEDYKLLSDGTRYGFGLNLSHYNAVVKARKEHNEKNISPYLISRESIYETWDARIGRGVDDKPFNTRHHELHDVMLIEKDTGKSYHIDCVMKQHYFGYYIALLIREEGTKSHGIVYWENINSKDANVIEGVEETSYRFRK